MPADVERLGELQAARLLEAPDLGPTIREAPLVDHACGFLGPRGCTVYDRRPDVCRRFPAPPACAMFAPDARLQLGLVVHSSRAPET